MNQTNETNLVLQGNTLKRVLRTQTVVKGQPTGKVSLKETFRMTVEDRPTARKRWLLTAKEGRERNVYTMTLPETGFPTMADAIRRGWELWERYSRQGWNRA